MSLANWFYHKFLDLVAAGLPVVFRNPFAHIQPTRSLSPQQLFQFFPLSSKPHTRPIAVSGDLTFRPLEKCELPTENAFDFLICLWIQTCHFILSCDERRVYPFSSKLVDPTLFATFCRPDHSLTHPNRHPLSPLIPGSVCSAYTLSQLPHSKKENVSLNPTLLSFSHSVLSDSFQLLGL